MSIQDNNLITSKQFHLTQLVVGDRFRYRKGKNVFIILEQNGTNVKIGNRHVDKTWIISTSKVVIKMP